MNITWNYKAFQVCRVCLYKCRVRCDFPLRTYCRNGFKICPEFNSKQLSLIRHTNNSHPPRRYSTNLNILLNNNETVINRYLNTVMEKYSSNADLANILGTTPHSKKIQDLLQLLYSRSSLCDSLKSLEELESGDLKDKELQSLAENEREDYKEQLRQLDKNLIMQLIPEEPYDILDDLLIEIKHGVGGQEAMLFAKDLFEMYCKYFVYKGWKYEIAELNISDIGGLRTSSILVYGTDAYKYMCYEGGVHRVQRIPSTEKGGRVHTSTVAVAVLPQPSEIDVVINDKDLKIETKRASGAGGQHVNTTDSAVRITHIPTGTVVECQEDRSQLKNKTVALQRLRTTIYQVQINEQLSKIRTKRKLQVGTSARSEKIRTYNFNQDRITDHRIGLSLYSMESFLEGTELLDKMLLALQEESHSERLSEFISNLEISQY